MSIIVLYVMRQRFQKDLHATLTHCKEDSAVQDTLLACSMT